MKQRSMSDSMKENVVNIEQDIRNDTKRGKQSLKQKSNQRLAHGHLTNSQTQYKPSRIKEK